MRSDLHTLKIKPLQMQTVRILQVVTLMLVVTLMSSCATTNQYISKLFNPRPAIVKDSLQLVRFLELDSLDVNKEGWVKTDIAKKDTTIVASIPVIEEPVAKTTNPDGTRTARKRE
jgi:hypothetical protein